MQKEFGFSVAKMVILIACILLMTGSCSSSKNEGFAIYLTEQNIPPAQMPALSRVELKSMPIISLADVITYNAQTHELKLTGDAFDRIAHLEVPVQGKSFVVCVDRKPIYSGAFWTPISSIGYDGVTIWKPLYSQATKIVTLELGYPSSAFYAGEDPRNSPEVLSSIAQAGKLVDSLSITGVEKLPDSMKGYELYSWFEDSQWYFTLITGTNRNKTFEEIRTSGNFISETGWVKIRMSGVDALETALRKLPEGEDVVWLALPPSEPASTGYAGITIPPGPLTNSIKAYASSLGLNFTVQMPDD